MKYDHLSPKPEIEAFVSYGQDGEDTARVEGYVAHPGSPPTIRMDPDDCDPGEPAELEVTACVDDSTGEDVSELIPYRVQMEALMKAFRRW